MNQQPLPFQEMVFVCTNKREPGERVSCAGQGRCGEEILMKLKTHVKVHHLEEVIRVAKSGCQEQCEKGPVLTVVSKRQTLTNLKTEDIPSLIQTIFSPLEK